MITDKFYPGQEFDITNYEVTIWPAVSWHGQTAIGALYKGDRVRVVGHSVKTVHNGKNYIWIPIHSRRGNGWIVKSCPLTKS